LSIELVSDTFDGEELQVIEIWSTNLALLKLVCSDLDELVEKKFPGMSFNNVVWFKNKKISPNILEWSIDGENGSLASIMTQRLTNLKISVCERDTREKIENLRVNHVLLVIASAFFLSHAWGDWSVRESSMEKVMDGLQRLFELFSGELVWTDGKDMAAETDFHRSMEEAIRGAQCIIICLSRLYLTRPNCLMELCWAIEEKEANDKPLLVVSVDPGVTFETVSQWRLDQDLVATDAMNPKDEVKPVTVDKRTVAFVQKRLRGVKIYEQWKQGEGSVTDAKRDAVEEMLNSIKNRKPRAARPKPALEVRKDDSKGASWWYIHEG
jgi:hypothetical protein